MQQKKVPWEVEAADPYDQTLHQDSTHVDQVYANAGSIGRGSLGQFIERSTSAPPASFVDNFDDNCNNNELLVGNDLLNHISKNYGGTARTEALNYYRNASLDQLVINTREPYAEQNTSVENYEYVHKTSSTHPLYSQTDASAPLSLERSSSATYHYNSSAMKTPVDSPREFSDFNATLPLHRGMYTRSQSDAVFSTKPLERGIYPPQYQESKQSVLPLNFQHTVSHDTTSNVFGKDAKRAVSTGTIGSYKSQNQQGLAVRTLERIKENSIDKDSLYFGPEGNEGFQNNFSDYLDFAEPKDGWEDIGKDDYSRANVGTMFYPNYSNYEDPQEFHEYRKDSFSDASRPHRFNDTSVLEHNQQNGKNQYNEGGLRRYATYSGPTNTSSLETNAGEYHALGSRTSHTQNNVLSSRTQGQRNQIPVNIHQQQTERNSPSQYAQFQNRSHIGNRQQSSPSQRVFVNSSSSTVGDHQYTTQTLYPTHNQVHQQSFHPSNHRSPRVNNSNNPQHFVSVLPVHGGGQQLIWQSDTSGQRGVGQVAVMNTTNVGTVSQIDGLVYENANPIVVANSSVHPREGYGRPLGREKVVKNRRGQSGGPAPHARRPNDNRNSSPPVCPLLEEFRASKNRDWTILNIQNNIVDFCQDQNGSRFIQQRLEMGDPVEHQLVMAEVLPAIRKLRNDVFGNYVVQKLLDFGTTKMKHDICKMLEGEMLQLSLQMYGCRVVQKALETLPEEDYPRLLLEFQHNVLSCIYDQNGNHVIQKCIEVLCKRALNARTLGDTSKAANLSKQIDFIVKDVVVNAASLSCHPYGCRVLQRILEHCDDTKKSEVLNEITHSHRKLLDDQYGNYVIQHVIQFGRDCDRDSVLGIVVENGLLGLSRQKFASNVVEKLLKYGNDTQRRAIVREMLEVTDDPSSIANNGKSSVVLLMVRDAFANYVVQTTLDVVVESEEKRLLLEELNAHAEELRNYTFAKHIVAKLSTMS